MSGNVQARQVGNVPMQQISQQQTNYMVAANVQAQEAGTLAQILNDMRATVLEFSGKKRMEEGLRYVAENPATKEQLDLAAGGITPPNLGGGIGKESGDLPSFFNQAVRKARSAELSSHFLIEGKSILSGILTDIQNGTPGVTPESIKTKINSATTGFSKTLSAVDPEAAIQFQASMAAHGNTVLNAAYESQLKKTQEQRKINFDAGYDNDLRLLEEDIKAGDKIDPKTGAIITIDDRINSQRQSITNGALAFGGLAMQKEYSEKYEIAVREAKINVITKSLIDDKTMTLEKIRTADIGKHGNLLKTLDQNSVSKITANYMTAVNYRNSEAKDLLQQQKIFDQKKFVSLYNDVLQLPENSKERKKLIDGIAVIAMNNPDVVPLTVLKDLRDPPKGEGNGQVYFNLRNMIYKNQITSPDQIWAMTKQGLSTTHAVAALDLFNRTDKQEQNKLDTGLARLSNIPIIQGQAYFDKEGTALKRYNELSIQADAIKTRYLNEKNVEPTADVILSELRKNIETQRSSETAKAARKSLESLEKLPWINGKITRDNLKSLQAKTNLTEPQKQVLRRADSLLTQAGE
jgi:hypothetical protein